MKAPTASCLRLHSPLDSRGSQLALTPGGPVPAGEGAARLRAGDEAYDYERLPGPAQVLVLDAVLRLDAAARHARGRPGQQAPVRLLVALPEQIAGELDPSPT